MTQERRTRVVVVSMGRLGSGFGQNMEGKSNRDDQTVEKIFTNHIPIKDLYIKNAY